MDSALTWGQILYAALFVALPVIWAWASTKGWQFFISRHEQQNQQVAQKETFFQSQQEAGSAALAQNLAITQSEIVNTNRQLITYLTADNKYDMDMLVREMGMVKERLSALQGVIVRLESASTIRTQEWSRMAEMWDDIDTLLIEIQDGIKLLIQDANS